MTKRITEEQADLIEGRCDRPKVAEEMGLAPYCHRNGPDFTWSREYVAYRLGLISAADMYGYGCSISVRREPDGAFLDLEPLSDCCD